MHNDRLNLATLRGRGDGMSNATVDVEGLYAALDARRQTEKLSWRGLAQKLGIAPSTFTRMAQGRRPDVDTFAALLRWLGMPVEAFMASSTETSTPDSDFVSKIGTYLRMDRNLKPEARVALEQLIKVAYETLRDDQNQKEVT
jgi:transcriptional regulator with XRE-family HTH domain